MTDKGKLHTVTAHRLGVLTQFAQRLFGQVLALQQAEQIVLLKVRVARQGEQDFLGRFLEKRLKPGAGDHRSQFGSFGDRGGGLSFYHAFLILMGLLNRCNAAPIIGPGWQNKVRSAIRLNSGMICVSAREAIFLPPSASKVN